MGVVEMICPICKKDVPSIVEHDILEHNGLDQCRKVHAGLCVHAADVTGEGAKCLCNLKQYEESAKKLGVET